MIIHLPLAITTCVMVVICVFHGCDACQSSQFGHNCTINCHCSTGTCNSTGHCSTCITGWSGPTCQILQGNVALKKPATQHTTDRVYESRHIASNAVDGSNSTYAYAKRKKNEGYAWWKVDLGQQYMLTRIHISFKPWPGREDNTWKRIFGFSVAVSTQNHSTPASEDHICFRDQWQNHRYSPWEYTLYNCSYSAQYVSIYNIRNSTYGAGTSRDAHIMLREVEVYRNAGCANGTYGSRCEHVCGHCVGETCERDTGNCSSGKCEPDWTGATCTSPATSTGQPSTTAAPCHCKGGCIAPGKCNECEAGWFGDSCEVPCPQNCSQEGCVKDTGNCRSCVDGIYGINCTKACFYLCKTCSSQSTCSSCPYGRYGQRCDQLCNNTHCAGVSARSECTSQDGACPGTCQRGWYLPTCSKQCPGNCSEGDCSQADGTCPGFAGSKEC